MLQFHPSQLAEKVALLKWIAFTKLFSTSCTSSWGHGVQQGWVRVTRITRWKGKSLTRTRTRTRTIRVVMMGGGGRSNCYGPNSLKLGTISYMLEGENFDEDDMRCRDGRWE